jgi:hypothetical protein
LDSAPLEDAVATQDTVTMLRGRSGAAGRLLTAVGGQGPGPVQRQDDDTAPGRPAGHWQDRQAREALVDALVGDAHRAHAALPGEQLDGRTAQAAALLATVTGQDIDPDQPRPLPKLCRDRARPGHRHVAPQARHGPRTAGHGWDGDKGHVAVDPDREVIAAAAVSSAATGDAVVAPRCLTTWSPTRMSRLPGWWSMAIAGVAPAPIWPGWTATG